MQPVQTLTGLDVYDPIYRPDGTWLYPYFQETQDVPAPDREFTNRALRACWRDSVPVGVMRQVSEKPTVRYYVLGLALVAGWEGGYFFLEGFAPSGIARERGPASEVESFVVEEEGEVGKSFDPASIIDARQRVIGQIVRLVLFGQVRKLSSITENGLGCDVHFASYSISYDQQYEELICLDVSWWTGLLPWSGLIL